MKRLFTLAALIFAATPVMAADMAVKAPPIVAAPVYYDILSANNQIYVDAVYAKFDYAEN